MSITRTYDARPDVFRQASDAAKNTGHSEVYMMLQAQVAQADVVLAIRRNLVAMLQDRLRDERDIGIVIGLIMADYAVGDRSATHILRALAGEANVTEPEMASRILAARARESFPGVADRVATVRSAV